MEVKRSLLLIGLLVGSYFPAPEIQNVVSPAKTEYRTPTPGRPLIIAHRGGAKESTENTISAFQRAIRIGSDGIETDLRLTADGAVIIYHDEKFGRVEGLETPLKPISEMPLAEITSHTLTPVGEDKGGRRVPTLENLLESVDRGLLNIEIKSGPRFDELVTRTIAILKNFKGIDRVVLESPELETARRLRDSLGSNLKLHINPAYNKNVPFESSLEEVLRFKPHSISVSYRKLTFETVELAHKAGVEVWVWTVDRPEIAEAMALLGADAIKTDVPSTMLRLFKRSSK
jgi:glycerophosphoryl diester phosphodiesterase